MNPNQEQFYNSYGKRTASGQYFTLKELSQKSFLGRIGSFCYYVIILFIVLLCLYYIYKIDIKNQSENINKATAQLANLTIDDIFNNTLQVGFTIKSKIVKEMYVASQNLKQLDQEYEISNRFSGFWKGTVETLTLGEKSNIDSMTSVNTEILERESNQSSCNSANETKIDKTQENDQKIQKQL